MFLKKTGIITSSIAADLLSRKKNEQLPIVSNYQKQFNVSRGTVQNALTFLKEKKAIVCESRGQLGTFLTDINYSILQTYALSGPVLGTMPLPYSKRYEGLATGLYAAFERQDIRLNLAYIRGAKERIRLVCHDAYRFAIVSKFAAKKAIAQGFPVQIALDFGSHSYLSQHVLLFADATCKKIEAGMKVGIDYTSHDQQTLVQFLTTGLDVTLVELSAHQLFDALRVQHIDAGVWNYDEIVDKGYQNVHHVFLNKEAQVHDMSVAVMLCKKEDAAMMAIVENNAIGENVLDVQQCVVSGKRIPNY